MPKKIWKPIIEGNAHKIELKWSIWNPSNQLSVDGKVVDVWVPHLPGSARHFMVGDKPAILQQITFGVYSLFIAGEKVKK